jgi:hypothetical protein
LFTLLFVSAHTKEAQIPAATAAAIIENIRAAHTARAAAHALLEKAKRAVEVAIEQGETTAMKSLS